MTLINYYRAFWARVAQDSRLTAHHVSLYDALLYVWNNNRFNNPLTLRRRELMQLSKIGSKDTYTKCLKELHKWNYIRYQPSANAQLRSQFYMFPFESSVDFKKLPDAELITRASLQKKVRQNVDESPKDGSTVPDYSYIVPDYYTKDGVLVLSGHGPDICKDTVPVITRSSPVTQTNNTTDNKDIEDNRREHPKHQHT